MNFNSFRNEKPPTLLIASAYVIENHNIVNLTTLCNKRTIYQLIYLNFAFSKIFSYLYSNSNTQ